MTPPPVPRPCLGWRYAQLVEVRPVVVLAASETAAARMLTVLACTVTEGGGDGGGSVRGPRAQGWSGVATNEM
jgi:hypothetical protein